MESLEALMAKKRIGSYIGYCGYTYTVEDVVEGYKKRLGNFYNSYTMNDVIDRTVKYLKILVNDK